jgi:two-component system LytT family sensor kinase
MFLRFHTGIIIYAVIMVVSNAVDSIRRLAQRDAEAAGLEAELARTQLEATCRQLEPQFLFNALNGIASLVSENRNDEAVARIAGLGDLLRRFLENSGRPLVPLAEELSFFESYLEIQSMRFGTRLKVIMDIPYEMYGALVPFLILQPLMEYTIRHGAHTAEAVGEIHVIARESAGTVSLRFRNSGFALPYAGDAGDAGGISTARDRLATLYGSTYRLELRNGEHAGTEAILTIPYKVEA